MKTYLVGGAIRDKLLGIEPEERDWVVVGSSQKELLELGYKQVGKQFPVFLHPDTSEEHALARVEKKVGSGHKGFEFVANEKVSLEEDLLRRDLTINAIAQDEKGELIDPFGGLADIENKVIRHVSEAFSEDPLRVLRVARFYTKLKKYGFNIHDSTIEIMKKIVSNDEIETLSKERLWNEISKAFNENNPWMFFEVLIKTNFAKRYCPEIIDNENIKEKILYFSKIDLEKKIFLSISGFSISFIEFFGFPKRILDLYFLFNEFSAKFISLDIESKKIVYFLNQLDAFRRPERLEVFLKQISYFLEFHNQKDEERLNIFTEIQALINGKIDYGDLKKLNVEEIKVRVENIHIELISTILNKENK
tara:strand:+ start:244 stop:1335 length:1092 start_codon:yes stop_codon:yes gene_type:complete